MEVGPDQGQEFGEAIGLRQGRFGSIGLVGRDGNGSVGHGSWVKWVTIFGWVTWVMGKSPIMIIGLIE